MTLVDEFGFDYIRVGTHRLRLVVDAQEWAEYQALVGATASLFGVVDTLTNRLLLNPAAARSQQRETAMHEVLHVLVRNAGGWGKHVSEEFACGLLAPGLVEVLRANPGFAAFCLENDA